MEFKKKIVVLGCGSIAQCAIPLLIKHLNLNPAQITVIDFLDNSRKIPSGINYVQTKITQENYQQILSTYLQSGDILLDLSWNIATLDLLKWCKNHDVRYVNTSVEVWNPFSDYSSEQSTLYHRQMEIRDATKSWPKGSTPTAVLDHGANPGLISSIAKQGILDIAKQLLTTLPSTTRKEQITKALADRDFSKLAFLINLKTIHISEKDTQVTLKHKKEDEFVNTWSVMGLYEEGIAPAELGWGTHENHPPIGGELHQRGPKNQAYLTTKGIDTWVETWVPSGPIKGMVIRHGEAFTLSEYLTHSENGEAIYRPTVHYAYRPCEEALVSLEDLKERKMQMPPFERIMNDEITQGKDELGCLLLGHDLGAWWIGSILDIEEARTLVPHQSATTVQVAIGVVAAVMYCVENPSKGICYAEHLPHDFVLKIAKPYLGEFVSMPSDWRPSKQPKGSSDWRFEVFRTTETASKANV